MSLLDHSNKSREKMTRLGLWMVIHVDGKVGCLNSFCWDMSDGEGGTRRATVESVWRCQWRMIRLLVQTLFGIARWS